MAITIQQSPTFPNIANNYLVYVVTSTEIAQPQYQFVLDIRDIDGNLVQRLKQQPNPSGKGVFDIGHLVSQQFNDLSQPQFSDLISDNASNPIINGGLWNQRYTFSFNNAGFLREFNVYFGEEYGTSTTSVVTLYNGAGVAGDPSVTSTTEYQSYLGGVLDTNGRYPIWEPSWNFTSLYDYTSWSVNKFYLYPGVFATAEYDGQGASTVGTPRGMRTGEGKWVPQPWWGVGSVIVDNWNLYIGDPYSQAFNFNIGLTKFPNEVKYGRLFREFYLYGDKVAKPQKLYWDDAYSLSFLSGQATPPSQSEGYIQNGQWIDTAFFQPEYKDTGFAPNFGEIEVQRNWLNYTTGGNFPWWVYNSASIKDNLTHLNYHC